jgi:uncharacterized protein YcaQ
LRAQGFGERRGNSEPDWWALRRVLKQVGLLQMDSVNVLVRAHYLPAFSRLGPYDRELVDRASHRAPRKLFEYVGHEASLLPVSFQPLLRWRMARASTDAWGSVRRIARERPKLIKALVSEIRERGPLAASDLAEDGPQPTGPWWDWSDVKWALAYLFYAGEVTTARRRNFERLYDVPERVLPKNALDAPTPPVADAQRELVRIAGRALGVATEAELRDYFRLPTDEAKLRVAELVEEGELAPVEVEGWGRTPGYLSATATVPRRISARALIGPFDSLIWERKRVARLFGFDYRIEIYVPAAKRKHGYYVLPFLLDDELVARVDLKSDRAAGALRVRARHFEDGAPPETGEALDAELESMASWLGLEKVGR